MLSRPRSAAESRASNHSLPTARSAAAIESGHDRSRRLGRHVPPARRLALRLLALACLSAFVAGCGGSDPDADALKSLESFGRLPGLKASPNTALREEMARIDSELGLPEQLAQNSIAPSENAATILAQLFAPERLRRLLEESWTILPTKDFDFSPVRLQKAIAFRTLYEYERLKAREALERPECRFPVGYLSGYSSLPFVDAVRLCVRLEAFHAAEQLAHDNVPQAIDALSVMLRLAALLGAEKLTLPRLEAAYARTEAYRVACAIVDHEKVTRANLEVLLSLILGQLEAWPPDADAWVGDRAMGMHAYELVRIGYVAVLLTPEELAEFERERTFGELATATRRTADSDELFYLRSMRRILESCKEPYYRRIPMFNELDQELARLKDTPEYPLVAARLLLADVCAGHEVQARDRANWEAWALGLSAALGKPAPPFAVNPLTGEPYGVQPEKALVVVRGIGGKPNNPDGTLVIPVPER
ncbi:MAG: hypothetical protein ACOY3P_18410 [Planctomycetota bacterium]